MEYTKRRRFTINTQANDLEKVYPHDLQMYMIPPGGEVSLTEFQALGLDRLKLLRHVESNSIRTDLKSIEERKTALEAALIQDGLKYFARLLQATGSKTSVSEADTQARRKDHISHYIIRLSCAQDPDRTAWFINLEVELFKLRFSSLNKEGIEHLLKLYKMDCEQITQEEKDELREELRVSIPKITNVDTTEFYKVSFKKVCDLVRTRKAFLKKGIAYISQADLGSLFVTYYKQILAKGLAAALSNVDRISDDERLTSFLFALPNSFSGMTRVVWSTSETPIENLDELSRVSYPLCMRVLHEGLRTHHHLKNSGRIQYGLFIKGIGVPLEDALRFWKTEFCKKIDGAKFDKEYAYTIRHTYGKEGRQTNYTPLGCVKIINSAVGPGEYHGCPFKHMDNESLKQKLLQYGVPAATVMDLSALAKEGRYTHACSKYFELVHKSEPGKPINHPNSYFAESRSFFTKDEPENTEKLSQSQRASDRSMGTPSRRPERGGFSTPSRTPSQRFSGTPARERNGTPLRRTDRSSLTPAKRLSAVPNKVDVGLNADEIAQLIDEY